MNPMKVNEQIAAAAQLAELWKLLLPTLGTPDLDQFLLWLSYHPEELVSFGINRAARKVRTMTSSGVAMDVQAAARYASSVMNNEAKGHRKFTTQAAVKQEVAAVTVDDADDNRGNH
jgi:hypothetical protein